METIKYNSKQYAVIGQRCNRHICKKFLQKNSYEKACTNPLATLLCPFSYTRAYLAVYSRLAVGRFCELRRLLYNLLCFFQDDNYAGIAIGIDYYRKMLSAYDKMAIAKKNKAARFTCLKQCYDNTWLHLFFTKFLIAPMVTLSSVLAILLYGPYVRYIILVAALVVSLYVIIILTIICDRRSCADCCGAPGRIHIYDRPNMCFALFLPNSNFKPPYDNKDMVHRDAIIRVAHAVFSCLESVNKIALNELFIIEKKDLKAR